jgi:hypothetical protein
MAKAGCSFCARQPLYVGEWFPTIKGVRNQIIAIFYACKATSNDVRLSEEHDHFEWIKPEMYKDFDMMDPDWDVIKTWITVRDP